MNDGQEFIYDLESPNKENTPLSSSKKRDRQRNLNSDLSPELTQKHRKKSLFSPQSDEQAIEPTQTVAQSPARVEPLDLLAPFIHQAQAPKAPQLDPDDFQQFLDEYNEVEGEHIHLDLDEDELELDENQPSQPGFQLSVQRIAFGPQRMQVNPVAAAPPPQPIHVAPVVAVAPVQLAVVAQPAPPVNYLTQLNTLNYDCPGFLNRGDQRDNKRVFEILHEQGGHFLCKRGINNRHWSQYPNHQRVHIQPRDDVTKQIQFPLSPKDITFHGTYVSAIMRDRHGAFYPVHLITKNTLGATNNIIGYPKKIRTLFNGNWASGLGRECLIIKVDKESQKRTIIRDYEGLVNQHGNRANHTLPNIRVFYKSQINQRHYLTKMFTPENCGQQNLLTYGFQVAPNQAAQNQVAPNMVVYAQALRASQRAEIDSLKVLYPAAMGTIQFRQACAPFFQPNLLTCEMALAQFTINEAEQFSQLIVQSRNTFIDLKGRVFGNYKGADFRHQNVQLFVQHIDLVIRTRTQIIETLRTMTQNYRNYLQVLTGLLNCTYQPNNISAMENVIYAELNNIIYHTRPNINLKDHFQSGRALISWMVTSGIEVNRPYQNGYEQDRCRGQVAMDICENLPAPAPMLIPGF